MDEQKEKAIEICKNLEYTIKNMGDNKPIESDSSVYYPTRAKKTNLIKAQKEIMTKYKLTKKDLK